MFKNKLIYSLLILSVAQVQAFSVRTLCRKAFATTCNMSLKQKFAAAAVFVSGGCCLKKKYEAYKVAQAILLEKRLIEKHKPEKRFTYGGVSEDITDAEAKEKREEYQFACMLAGYKDVYLGSLGDKRAFAKLSGFTELCRLKKIKELQMRTSYGNAYILYTPVGEQNALLLKKWNEEKGNNLYINGYMLGYREKNIKLFYKKMSELTGAPNYFEEDRNTVKDWIEHQGVTFIPVQ